MSNPKTARQLPHNHATRDVFTAKHAHIVIGALAIMQYLALHSTSCGPNIKDHIKDLCGSHFFLSICATLLLQGTHILMMGQAVSLVFHNRSIMCIVTNWLLATILNQIGVLTVKTVSLRTTMRDTVDLSMVSAVMVTLVGEVHSHGATQPCIQAKSTRHPRGCGAKPHDFFYFFYFFPVKIT